MRVLRFAGLLCLFTLAAGLPVGCAKKNDPQAVARLHGMLDELQAKIDETGNAIVTAQRAGDEDAVAAHKEDLQAYYNSWNTRWSTELDQLPAIGVEEEQELTARTKKLVDLIGILMQADPQAPPGAAPPVDDAPGPTAPEEGAAPTDATSPEPAPEQAGEGE